MRNLKRKLALASIMLCGSVALGLGSLNATPTAAAETLDGFEVKSAALRLPDSEYGQGIRFTITLGNVTLADGATTGVLLIPKSSLGDKELTLELNHQDLQNVTDIQWKTFADGTKEAYLHLYNVPSADFATKIAICAYIDHDANPATAPIYSNAVASSVAEVAAWAYENDETLTAGDKENLQSTYLSYKVFYHNGDDVTETTGVYGQMLTAIEEPTKTGYTFDGWWNSTYEHEWDFATTTVKSTTTNLYAKWAPATDTAYTVKVYQTTDGGEQEDVTAMINGFVSSRTGTTDSFVDLTEEAYSLVETLGDAYTLYVEESVLGGKVAADGTTELKIVVNYDEFVGARVGDNANTLLFFDKELGVKQVLGATGNSYGYTTDKKYGDEKGSLKVTFPNSTQHNTIDLDYKGYALSEDDYIEFYVYNDTNTPTLSLMFGYSNSTQLVKGEWTHVIGSAAWIMENKYFRFYGQAANFGSGTNVDGSVYISKVKAGNGFADLTAATGEWTIGEMTFTGAVTNRNNAPNDQVQKVPYKVGNSLQMKLWQHAYAGFEATLATSIDATAEDKYVSFTVKGADANLFTIVEFGTDGAAKTGATKACVTRAGENGFTTYVFRIAKGLNINKFRVTPLGDTSATTGCAEIIISNVTVGNYTSLRTGEDANTLFFMDVPLGTTLQQVYRKNQSNLYAAEYTTEMAYGNERGSLKATVSRGQQESYHNITWTDADKNFLADTDYVVFYLYSTYSKSIFFSFDRNYATTGWELMPNHWNRIVVSAKVLKASTWTLIDTRMYAKETDVYFDLYMSKFVRYTADEVARLENMDTTDTWTLGSTMFVGAPTISNGSTSTNYHAGLEHKKAYIVDGELSITFVRCADGYINLKLAQSIEVAANTEKYVTVLMYNYGRLDKLNGYLNNSGSYALSYVSHEDVGGGYAKVTFQCAAKSSAYTLTSVRLDVEDHSDSTMATQFRIKDIVIS